MTKNVKIERPHNILNPAPDADRRINTSIKALVFWWSGLTLFYLWSGLEISKKSEFLGIKFENFTEQKFLAGLLILNIVFLWRLIWRIYISAQYNQFYDEAVVDSDQAENPKIGTVENIYAEKMDGFSKLEKQLLGLGIPIFMGYVAISLLSCHLAFACVSWVEMLFWFSINGALFINIAMALTLILSYRRYWRETEKK